jgi:hypothetical protein
MGGLPELPCTLRNKKGQTKVNLETALLVAQIYPSLHDELVLFLKSPFVCAVKPGRELE